MDKVLMEIIARLMGTRKFSKLADGSALKSSIFDRRLRLTKALPDLLVWLNRCFPLEACITKRMLTSLVLSSFTLCFLFSTKECSSNHQTQIQLRYFQLKIILQFTTKGKNQNKNRFKNRVWVNQSCLFYNYKIKAKLKSRKAVNKWQMALITRCQML